MNRMTCLVAGLPLLLSACAGKIMQIHGACLPCAGENQKESR